MRSLVPGQNGAGQVRDCMRRLDELALDAEDVETVLDYACLIARHRHIFFPWRPPLRDPKDDMVAELALPRVAAIVTHNRRDFEEIESLGVRVMGPAFFLCELERKTIGTWSLRLSDSLYKQLAAVAKEEGISINQLINSAVSEKLAALITEGYIEEGARRGSQNRFEKAMARVSDIEPEVGLVEANRPELRLAAQGCALTWPGQPG